MALKNLLTSLPYWNPWFKSGHKIKDGTVFVSELGFATALMDLRLGIWWQSGSHQKKDQQECQQLRETCEEQAGSRKKSSVKRVKFACAMPAGKQFSAVTGDLVKGVSKTADSPMSAVSQVALSHKMHQFH